jgi:beta-1,4-mannosyltransferase
MPVPSSRRTLVVALADLGRSPRMQRHALALAQASPDVDVEIVGYEGSPVQMPVTAEPRLRCRRLPSRHDETMSAWWNPLALTRSASRSAQLGRVVFGGARPNVILVQSPTTSSARTLSWAASKLRGARLVIDWHDRSAVAGRGSDRASALEAASRRERRWARRAHAHLASSRAMAEWLGREYKVQAAVLYDRPASWFGRPNLASAADLWQRLARDLSLGARRIPIAICPTGWTPSDDFDLLLESLERAERRLSTLGPARDAAAPDLAVLLTGRGALRSAVEARLARRAFSRVAVRTTWLEPADYVVLVGMADIGICLHQSASGLDLPGKLAELRGAGVPAYAFDYAPVLGEVLETGKQGVTFRDPGQLATALVALATNDLESQPALTASRAWLAAHPAERWEEHWQAVAAPLLTR